MKIRTILENFIIVAIILVIVQTFVYELCILLHWQVRVRDMLMISGLCFDALFTSEFIVRGIASGRRREFVRYFLHERGWVDFISSVPLLLLDSVPSVYMMLAGHIHGDSAMGVMNALKIVKAIRITRILRLLRIIKIFGKIHNVESAMAQHHTASIATTAVFSIVCTMVIISVVADSAGMNEKKSREAHYAAIFKSLEPQRGKGRESARRDTARLLSADRNVLTVTAGDEKIVSNITDDDFRKMYSDDDCITVEEGPYTAVISIVDLHRRAALNHIEGFAIIVTVVLAIMFIYARHFAQNVSDIVHILNKGFRKKDYNLQVKIKEIYSDDEIFSLARFYNDAYLPMKLRKLQEAEQKKESSLSLDDLKGFGKK